MDNSLMLVGDYHPLKPIDDFILSFGWTNTGQGFVAPESWVDMIAVNHGRGNLWRREHAVQFCIRYAQARDQAIAAGKT